MQNILCDRVLKVKSTISTIYAFGIDEQQKNNDDGNKF